VGGDGGGVYAAGGNVRLLNDTVECNSADVNAGGIYIDASAQVSLDAFTLANVINNTGGDIYGTYTIN
jgi:hypothetical protein